MPDGNATPSRRYDSRPTSLQSPLNFVFAFRRKLRSLPCISSSQCARSAGPHREPCMAANRAVSSKQARFIRRWRRFAHFPHFLWVAPKGNPPEGLLAATRLTLAGRAQSKENRLGAKRRDAPYLLKIRGPQQGSVVVEARCSVGRGPRPRNLHIPRFRLTPKAHSFRCSVSPHKNRPAGFSWGPRNFRSSATRIGVTRSGKD